MMKRLLQSTALMAALAATSSVPAAADVYIIGSNVNGVEWVTADPGGLMTETSAGVFEWDGDVLGSEFKFNDGTWSGDPFPGTDIPSNIGAADYSEKVVLGEPYTVSAGGNSNNLSFANGLLEIRKPHVVLDLNTLTLTVTGDANTEVTVQYHLVGDFNEWDMNATMGIFAPQEDGTYLLKGVTLVTDKSVDSLPELVVAADGYVRKYGSPTTATYPFLLEEQTVYPLEENGLNIPYDCNGVYDVIFTPGDNPTLFLQRVSDVVIEKGTSENPWTVTELLAKDPDTEAITTGTWTTGYIVGWVNGKAYETGVQFEFAEGVEVSTTNILIAASKDERDYTKCMPVQLPSGEVRDALNLFANPDNLGCRVDLFGNFEKYFSVAGIKAVSDYAFYDAPVIPDPEIDYTKFVFAISNVVNEETSSLSFTGYGMENVSEESTTEFIARNVKCDGVHYFALSDWDMYDMFLSHIDEGIIRTQITSNNLSGELTLTNKDLIGNEGEPAYYAILDLSGFYDVKVRYEGKKAYIEFIENTEYTDRYEAIANYAGDFYLTGDVNGWQLADEAYKMTRVDAGVYQWEGVIKGGFKFNDGTENPGFIEGTEVPLNIASLPSTPLNLGYWTPLTYSSEAVDPFQLADSENEYDVVIFLDLVNNRVGVAENTIDYSQFNFTLYNGKDENGVVNDVSYYLYETSTDEYMVYGIDCSEATNFLLNNTEGTEFFLSYGNETEGAQTVISESNLSGKLYYHNSNRPAENVPEYVGNITGLSGYYNVIIRFNGKVADVEFVKNELLDNRRNALANNTGDFYVVGECNDWTLADEAYKMTRTDVGVYEWSGILKGEFKFNNGTWEGGYLDGTDIPLELGALPGTNLEIGYWNPISYEATANQNFTLGDGTSTYNVTFVLDLLNGSVAVSGEVVEEPDPDPETVWVYVTVEGGAKFGFQTKNHEPALFALFLDEEYWNIDSMEVNGVVYEHDYPNLIFNHEINGETEYLIRVSYKGELAFVDSTTGVVELENAAKIYVADGKVNIENLNVGDEIVVYNTGGQIISRYVAQSTSLSISLDRGQVYVVRAGTAAAKVML